ncbi:cell surface glycoprotein MUC18 [Scophthalmus maximus]|uniref:Ig-like domain-containing protein n=1 Tax=Scophthalmus maximus TaxID=52904 RepID=A0A8D3B357_SCOMX|nr:cell surface glycoprotein MUC18 [Scophthalmus maximus]
MAFSRGAFVPLFLHLCLLVWSAWAKVNVTMPETVEVYLGDTAQILLQYRFDHNESNDFLIQWIVRNEDNSRRRIWYYDNLRGHNVADRNTAYTDRIEMTKDQQSFLLTIEDVQLSDEREFYCQVNGLEARTSLRVFAPPEAPVIEGVTAAISVTNDLPSEVATCVTKNGYPRPKFTWYRNNVPLMADRDDLDMLTLSWESQGLYTVQSTLQYKVTKEDKDAEFSCEVSFLVPGTIRRVKSSSVNVTVHYPTTMAEMWRESPQGLVKEGDTVELRCQGDGNPPSSFNFSREQEQDVDLGSSGDVLILAPVSRKDSGIYQCWPLDGDGHGEVKGEMQLTVHYLDPAVVVPKESELMLKGEDLTASCNALSSLRTSTVWYKDGKQVSQGNTLHLQDATYATTGEYICEVTVPSLPALHTSGSVHIVVQGPPQLVGMEEVKLEEATGRMVNLTCEAHGHPLPSISWSVIGTQNWREVWSRENEHGTQSVASVKVTSDVVAQCNASNDIGAEVKTFLIKALPRDTTTTSFSPAEGSGIIIVVIIVCLLLLANLGGVLYFLQKKGKIHIPCGRSGKQEITKEIANTDDIVVEMKSSARTEDAVLLKAFNGDKQGPDAQ